LGAPDLQRLNDWLSWRKAQDGRVQDIHALDGYIACVAVSPRAISLGDWLGWLFNGRPPMRDEWPFIDMMVRRLAQVVLQLEEPSAAYVPWLESHKQLGERRVPLRTWSRGFMVATALQGSVWEDRRYDPELERWLRPIRDACEQPDEAECEFGLVTLKRAVSVFNGTRQGA
jgi:yecA family protein